MKDLDDFVTDDAIPAVDFNLITREIQLAVEGSGQSLDAGTFEQLLLAITQVSVRANFQTSGGTATVITLTPPGGTIGPETLQEGVKVQWRPLESCPGGAITVNLNGIGAKVLKDEEGDNLLAGVYDTLKDVTARFKVSTQQWLLTTPVQNQTPLANMVDNSDFTVWQHLGTAAENFKTDRDVTSLCTIPRGGTEDYDIPVDRWHVISDGDDVVTVQRHTSATVADGFLDAGMRSAVALTVVTPNKKFGFLQNLESWRTLDLFHGTGRKASISFKARAVNITSGNLKVLKAALVSVTGGTPDIQTVTPIATWNVNSTPPTLISAHTFENTVASLGNPPSGSWTKFTIENIDVDALPSAISNLKLMVWIDNPTDTEVGDELFLSEFKVESGAVATRYEREDYAVELTRCRRQFQHLGYSTEVADISIDGELIGTFHGESESGDDHGLAVFPLTEALAVAPLAANCVGVGTLKLSFITGDNTHQHESADAATNLEFTTFGQSRANVTGQLLVPVLDNDPHTWQIRADDAVDGDGFVTDGIFVRTQI